jgi:hypothetical protein
MLIFMIGSPLAALPMRISRQRGQHASMTDHPQLHYRIAVIDERGLVWICSFETDDGRVISLGASVHKRESSPWLTTPL